MLAWGWRKSDDLPALTEWPEEKDNDDREDDQSRQWMAFLPAGARAAG